MFLPDAQSRICGVSQLQSSSRDGFKMLMLWMERRLKLWWQKQLTRWKRGEHMKANYSRKRVVCAWFLSVFLFVQRCSLCTVCNKWLSPSMGHLGTKKTKNKHLEAIFGGVLIQSGAVKIQISVLFDRAATTPFFILNFVISSCTSFVHIFFACWTWRVSIELTKM